MLSWFDAHPSLYGWFVCAAVALAVGPILLACLQPDPASATRSDWRWGAVILTVLTAGRWPSWFYTRGLNPDESHLITGAFTLRHDPMFWRSVDGASAGPLDFFALWPVGWLHGADDYFSARVTACLLLALALLFAHQTLALVFGRLVARVGTFSTVCFTAFTLSPNFAHYSSELAALPPLAAAVLLAVRRFFNHADWRWNLLGGALLGAVPFAKLQAAPPALFVGLAWIAGEIVLARSRRETSALPRRLAALVGSALAPSLLVAVALSATGQWTHAYIPYLAHNLHYVGTEILSFSANLQTMFSFSAQEGGLLLPWLFGGLLCLAGALLLRRAAAPCTLAFVGFVALLFFLSVFSVLLPGRPFLHYCQLLVVPSALLFGSAFGLATAPAPAGESARRPRALLCAGLVVSSGFLLAVRVPASTPHVGQLAFWRDHPQERLAAALAQLSAPDEAIAIWGWANHLYVEARRREATRSIQSEPLILDSPHLDYYRRRYLDDLRTSRPPVFLDASAPGGFLFTTPEFRHEVIFPELAAHVRSHYTLIAEAQGHRIYLRNDRVGRPLPSPR